MIAKYVKNTHAKTHTAYKLQINDIFTVERKNEKKRFKPFRQKLTIVDFSDCVMFFFKCEV